jgi:tetratricopeptide (TPR) repeat protein
VFIIAGLISLAIALLSLVSGILVSKVFTRGTAPLDLLFLLLLLIALTIPLVEGLRKRGAGRPRIILPVVSCAAALMAAVYSTGITRLHADIAYNKGRDFLKAGRLDAACEKMRKARRLYPAEDEYMFGLGLTKYKIACANEEEALMRQAIDVFMKARDRCRLEADHSANLARLYWKLAGFAGCESASKSAGRKADICYRQASRLKPRDVGLLCERAELNLRVLHDIPRALALIEKALRIDPRFLCPYELKAKYYRLAGEEAVEPILKHKNFSRALETWERALRLLEGNTDHQIRILNKVIELCHRMGEPEKALPYLEAQLKRSKPANKKIIKLMISECSLCTGSSGPIENTLPCLPGFQ